MFSYTKNQWLPIPSKRKLDAFSVIVILVMSLPVASNMLVMNFSLGSFNVILNDDSFCYGVQEPMEQEAEASELYVRKQTWENAKQCRLACFEIESSIDALPFDYDVIGSERYAKTWNIRNGYEGYRIFRDQVLYTDQSEDGFVGRLYGVYGMQGYLQTYVRRLMQPTLEEGKHSYQEKVPLLCDFLHMIMICSILVIVTVICLTKLLSNTLIVPMVKLAHSSREIARNDFGGEDLVAEDRDEMGELVQAFNKMKHAIEGYISTLKEKNEMVERLHKEEMERIEIEERLDTARLELPKSQINPHFLFNMLSMIPCMAELEEAQITEWMIFNLRNLSRYSLKASEQIVPLDQELKVVQDYIHTQQICFDSRVSHNFRVEADGSETMISAFTLQSLVENAIIRGIARKEEEGRTFLRIWKQKDKLVISLADTEVGMDEETLKRLMDAFKGHRTARAGIGLGNIYQRTESIYEDGGLRIYSRAGKGIVVQAILPTVWEEDYQKM